MFHGTSSFHLRGLMNSIRHSIRAMMTRAMMMREMMMGAEILWKYLLYP